jgi:hypothetical protein
LAGPVTWQTGAPVEAAGTCGDPTLAEHAAVARDSAREKAIRTVVPCSVVFMSVVSPWRR